MNILVTGSAGFLGRNLVENLKTIRDGKNRTRPQLSIGEIYEYDKTSTIDELNAACENADFVFHLAGVNRPQDPAEFRAENIGFTSTLLNTLKKFNNKAPVMISSSVQAALSGRFGTSEYGSSKRDSEELMFSYGEEIGAPVFVYRFPNLVGKWIRPNYNSAVATFCYNISRDLPITVNDPDVELEMLFADDLCEEMYDCLEGHPHRCEYPKTGEIIDGVEYDGLTPRWSNDGRYCGATVTHKATLGHIAELLNTFHDMPQNFIIPAIPEESFEKKLLSMYLSYLPKEKTIYDLKMNVDDRGSFTELVKTLEHGQVSVNISKPGITKGQHWHLSKWELFIVVAGHGLIQMRNLLNNEIEEYEVDGSHIQAVYMKPGWTHNIINLSCTDDLITIMFANEMLNQNQQDTYFEPVK